jgi:similar to stage IV sporulation protein
LRAFSAASKRLGGKTMKPTTFLTSLRGYVRIEVTGSRLETLINRMVQSRFEVWDISYTKSSAASMMIGLNHFFRLRPLLKETGSRFRIRSKHGLPFMVAKLLKRKFFAAGMLMFIAGIYLLASIVWQVRVEGNDSISVQTVLQAARQVGIYQLQWKGKLKDQEQLAMELQTALPGTSWVGVEVRGTHVVIKIVEARTPDQKPLASPRHMVATKNALVTSIFAEKGKPLVKTNSYVRKGDILISGIIGDEQNQMTVVASGKVKGLVWYMPKVEVPLTQTYKVYTGEVNKKRYLVLGSRGIQLTGYLQKPLAQFETVPELHYLQWRSYTLPIGWLDERLMATGLQEQPLDPEEARKIGLEQARAEILSVAGKESKIVSEKILHEKTENGKVYMEVHLEVEEYIMQESPINP